MLPEKERHDVLARVIEVVPYGGWVLIVDERSNIQGFKDVFAASGQTWEMKFEAGCSLFFRRS